MAIQRKEVPAGAFKQGCLALRDEVAATKRELVITKRGKPVARLVPMEDPRDRERELLAHWRGKARQLVQDDEFLMPSYELVSWQACGAPTPHHNHPPRLGSLPKARQIGRSGRVR